MEHFKYGFSLLFTCCLAMIFMSSCHYHHTQQEDGFCEDESKGTIRSLQAYVQQWFSDKPDFEIVKPYNEIYDACRLNGLLDYEIFQQAMTGFNNVQNTLHKDLLTIVDFSKPSTEKRCFVLDLKNQKLLYHTLVAHGKNTGINFAKKFSNKSGSYQSSLGFYKTAETYIGKHGYSLRLDGMEKNINHKARERAIVIHGADYVSDSFIRRHGRLGRSWGCPALPVEQSEEIITTIKDGSCLFVYGENENYFQLSQLLQPGHPAGDEFTTTSFFAEP